ncbi:nucleotidyltransferase domain-containing protein [Paraburkholderia unamae]|uniref:Nucleotidyltransferase domain-containing protein n=1 Tax=Paraburkholderia unamae TaxID=219649 RepID=A0ACC6RRR3_9BURK
MLTDDDIARMAAEIARAIAPVAVGTFGSYSVGMAKDGSDLDLFVIVETNATPLSVSRLIRRHLYGVMHPLDIHVFRPDAFEEEAAEYLSFAWVIARQARIYYASSDAQTKVPALFARKGI